MSLNQRIQVSRFHSYASCLINQKLTARLTHPYAVGVRWVRNRAALLIERFVFCCTTCCRSLRRGRAQHIEPQALECLPAQRCRVKKSLLCLGSSKTSDVSASVKARG
jgi:hypothetical protein